MQKKKMISILIYMLLMVSILLAGTASTIDLTDTGSYTGVGVSQLMLLRIKSNQDISVLPQEVKVVGEKPDEWTDLFESGEAAVIEHTW